MNPELWISLAFGLLDVAGVVVQSLRFAHPSTQAERPEASGAEFGILLVLTLLSLLFLWLGLDKRKKATKRKKPQDRNY